MEVDVGIDIHIENIAWLCKIMSICNKQHLSNIWCSIREKLSNTEAELKKCVAYKKSV